MHASYTVGTVIQATELKTFDSVATTPVQPTADSHNYCNVILPSLPKNEDNAESSAIYEELVHVTVTSNPSYDVALRSFIEKHQN